MQLSKKPNLIIYLSILSITFISGSFIINQRRYMEYLLDFKVHTKASSVIVRYYEVKINTQLLP